MKRPHAIRLLVASIIRYCSTVVDSVNYQGLLVQVTILPAIVLTGAGATPVLTNQAIDQVMANERNQATKWERCVNTKMRLESG
jgi:hypothetical protein